MHSGTLAPSFPADLFVRTHRKQPRRAASRSRPARTRGWLDAARRACLRATHFMGDCMLAWATAGALQDSRAGDALR